MKTLSEIVYEFSPTGEGFFVTPGQVKKTLLQAGMVREADDQFELLVSGAAIQRKLESSCLFFKQRDRDPISPVKVLSIFWAAVLMAVLATQWMSPAKAENKTSPAISNADPETICHRSSNLTYKQS